MQRSPRRTSNCPRARLCSGASDERRRSWRPRSPWPLVLAGGGRSAREHRASRRCCWRRQSAALAARPPARGRPLPRGSAADRSPCARRAARGHRLRPGARRHRERRDAGHEGDLHAAAATSCASPSCGTIAPCARRSRRERRTSRSSSAGIRTAPGEACAGSRAVRADGDRSADGGVPPARGRRGRGRPATLRRRRALRLGDGAAASPPIPAAGHVSVGFELYAHRRGAKARDTILVSAGSDGVPTTAGRVALLALLEPLRDRRDIVLVDARGTGAPGGSATGATPTGRAPLQRIWTPSAATLGIGHVELYGAGDGARIALAYAARLRRPPARARARRRSARDALQRRRPRRGARARKALGPASPSSARLAARLRTRPLHVHGRIDDDVLARIAARGDARHARPSSRPRRPPRCTATPRRSRGSSRAAAPAAARQAAQAQASTCHDDAPPAASRPGGRRAVHARRPGARPRPGRLPAGRQPADARSRAAGRVPR